MQNIDDLKKQLEAKTNELEAVKKAAIEQTAKYNDNVKKLIRLLARAYRERDEAKGNLQQLLLQTNQALAAPSTMGMPTLPSTLFPQSHSIAVNNATVRAATSTATTLPIPSPSPQSPYIMVDSTTAHATARLENHQTDWTIIENLAKGGPGPQQGQLLTAVCEASQLFNSVAKACSHSVLPMSQTPPQVLQAPQVPPTPVRVHKARGQPRTASSNSHVSNGSSSSSTSLSASTLWSLDSTDQIQMPKRQRIYIDID